MAKQEPVDARLHSSTEQAVLTEELIKMHVSAWKGEILDPERPNELDATIVEADSKGVRIRIPSGNRLIPFEQIINADKVILHCEAIGREPTSKDFKEPYPALGVKPIHNYSYAPPLAKHVRRQIERKVRSPKLPEEVPEDLAYCEGHVQRIIVNRYERDPEARRACIRAHGTSCCVCGFSFGSIYGPVAEGYTHVHHLHPLSEIGGEYVVDPIEDLRPVCPNCHAVLHRSIPPYSIEEVQAFLK